MSVGLYLPEDGIRLGPGRVMRHDWRNDDPDHWQKGRFSVPERVGYHPVTEADVEDKYPYFRNKFGLALEQEGWKVLSIEGPFLDTGTVARGITDADRRAYVMWARVERAPTPITVKDLPDDLAAELEPSGLLKLKD